MIITSHDLSFSEHINNIVFKAHQRANAILCCFVSRNITLLLRAYLVYVRPLLEYNSTIWSPHYKYDIDAVERVQRLFTKRLPPIHALITLAYVIMAPTPPLSAQR